LLRLLVLPAATSCLVGSTLPAPLAPLIVVVAVVSDGDALGRCGPRIAKG